MTTRPDYPAWVGAIRLERISLVSASVARTGNPSDDDPSLDVRIFIEPAHRYNHPDLEYRFKFAFDIRDGDETVAEISATYSCLYAVELDEAEDNHISRFAQDVVIMNVFPYARELVQSMAGRVDLPALTLGLIKRGQARVETRDRSEDSE